MFWNHQGNHGPQCTGQDRVGQAHHNLCKQKAQINKLSKLYTKLMHTKNVFFKLSFKTVFSVHFFMLIRLSQCTHKGLCCPWCRAQANQRVGKVSKLTWHLSDTPARELGRHYHEWPADQTDSEIKILIQENSKPQDLTVYSDGSVSKDQRWVGLHCKSRCDHHQSMKTVQPIWSQPQAWQWSW